MVQNCCGFHGLPNICENFIRGLGVLAVLSRDSGQHMQKSYPQIFIFGPICKNFVLQKFPAIRYCTYVSSCPIGSIAGEVPGEEGDSAPGNNDG